MDTKKWHSPTLGIISFDEVTNNIKEFILSGNDMQYELFISTDSMVYTGQGICYVSSIVIHRISKYCKYYYTKELDAINTKKIILSTRMYNETYRSILLAQKLMDIFHKWLNNNTILNICVHLDLGGSEETRKLINSYAGMVKSFGFNCNAKPDELSATKVSDKFTKSI